MRREFQEKWDSEQEKQRYRDIMEMTEEKDSDPTLDVQRTFKLFVAEKKFSDSHSHLTIKEYSKLKFANSIPEIVCDILYYLCKYKCPTPEIPKESYERLL